jgi:uncharacterized integral membrane protein
VAVRRKLIFGLLVIPLGVLLVALAVVNRKPATLVLDPLGGADPRFAVDVPLFLLLLGALALGLLIGGFATWLGQSNWRRMARQRGQESAHWRRQADRLEKELEAMDATNRPSPLRNRLTG